MSTDLNASFSEQFMNINTKLKKRFMRRPNIAEATNEFVALAIQCENAEQPSFAGQAYIGAAKCEASAGNTAGEVLQYLAAARQFLKAEKRIKQLKFSNPDRENVEAAIGCYMQAINKSPLKFMIYVELASQIFSLGYRNEAITYYEEALNMIDEKENFPKVEFMKELIDKKIECCKYESALDTANKMFDICNVEEFSEYLLSEIQVCRVLLALLVEPAEESIPVHLKQLLSDFMNDTESKAIPINTDLRLKLQSLIISCNTSDLTSLVSVSADVRQNLTERQNQLLDELLSSNRLKSLSLD